jgi:uncharacterized protein YyaL (SSP411 family)
MSPGRIGKQENPDHRTVTAMYPTHPFETALQQRGQVENLFRGLSRVGFFFTSMMWLVTAISWGQVEAQESKQENPAGEKRYTNELSKETSPYLLMHAHNPVNWHAWNEQTLAKAQQQDRPIFLSIGYSSCHWCHVMERESFMDEEIASFLNEHFVCIKVDREERPDVDEIYMQALMTWNRISGNGGGGGWPLSMFLLPDGRPFFGGTYFPARTGDRGNRVGFLTVVQKIDEFFVESRDRVEKDAALITSETKKSLEGRVPVAGQTIQRSWLRRTLEEFQSDFDPIYGAFVSVNTMTIFPNSLSPPI